MRDIIGASLPRHDAKAQVTGRARYGADVDMPNMLHCKIKRSERAHARILGIDTSAAEKLAGVQAVITHKDVTINAYGETDYDQPVLAGSVVRGYCDAVAAVAAETPETAQKAVDLIKVEYETLPGVFTAQQAMEKDCYQIHAEGNIPRRVFVEEGNVEEGFARAKYVLAQTFSSPAVEQAHIEPHAGIAYVDEFGILNVRSSVQRPFSISWDIAKATGLPHNKIRLSASSVGGGFGGKNEMTHEGIIGILALKTMRPVKMEYAREDEFNATTIRHPYEIRMKTGIDAKGKVLARSVYILSDGGPYVTWGYSTLMKACIHACGPYDIPNMRVEGYLTYTNNSIGGAMRGFGVTQLGFAYEVHMDYCAKQIGMDPIAFRRLNFIHDGSKLPTGMAMNIVTVEDTLERAIALAKERGDWE